MSRRLCLPLLLAPLLAASAHAKAPNCYVEIDAVEFTRAEYAAGDLVEGRVDGTVRLFAGDERIERGHRAWSYCLDMLGYVEPLQAAEPESGHRVEIWFLPHVPEGPDPILMAETSSLQAGGLYTVPAGRGNEFVELAAPIVLRLAPNPDVDLEPPTLTGVRVRTHARPRQPDVSVRGADATLWGSAEIRLERADGRIEEQVHPCTNGWLCRHGARNGYIDYGHYRIAHIRLVDALGNTRDYASHPLFDGLEFTFGPDEAPVDTGRGTLTPLRLSPRPTLDLPLPRVSAPRPPLVELTSPAPAPSAAPDPSAGPAPDLAAGCAATPADRVDGHLLLLVGLAGLLRGRRRGA